MVRHKPSLVFRYCSIVVSPFLDCDEAGDTKLLRNVAAHVIVCAD